MRGRAGHHDEAKCAEGRCQNVGTWDLHSFTPFRSSSCSLIASKIQSREWNFNADQNTYRLGVKKRVGVFWRYFFFGGGVVERWFKLEEII